MIWSKLIQSLGHIWKELKSKVYSSQKDYYLHNPSNSITDNRPMNYKEIQDLIKLVSQEEISELKLKDGDFELTVRSNDYSKISGSSQSILAAPAVMPTMAPAQQTSETSASPENNQGGIEASETEDTTSSNLLEVRSPIVGTFYRSSSPDKPNYVSVGDTIDVGSVVCIVEAMKLFNEIESEVAGKIVKVMIDDASPVEYDQVLFLVDAKG